MQEALTASLCARLKPGALGEPANADRLFALSLVERQVECGERLLVLGYPSVPQGAQTPGRARELRGQLSFGPLCNGVARSCAGGVAAGVRQ